MVHLKFHQCDRWRQISPLSAPRLELTCLSQLNQQKVKRPKERRKPGAKLQQTNNRTQLPFHEECILDKWALTRGCIHTLLEDRQRGIWELLDNTVPTQGSTMGPSMDLVTDILTRGCHREATLMVLMEPAPHPWDTHQMEAVVVGAS